MKNILLLVDYRDQFWLKTEYKEQSVDVNLLATEFERLGYAVSIKSFNQIDFLKENFKGFYVFYQSSEDPGLVYKSYIADILLGLKLNGAILIPDFEYFTADHNKVFMEILRMTKGNQQMNQLWSKIFGTYEEFKNDKRLVPGHKYVFKLSSGTQSKAVKLLDSKRNFYSIPRIQSLSFNFYYWLVDQIKPFLGKSYPGYKRKSHHRKKFIIQEYISGLTGDYKVLVFDNKVFVLYREIRPNDFRASGSGKFSYLRNIPHGLLDFSIVTYKCFDVPFISLDVAIKDEKFYLLEFQFVHIGTYTAEKSPFHFQKIDGAWKIIDTTIIIETEYAEAIHSFIANAQQRTK
jgi:hypothetical protein